MDRPLTRRHAILAVLALPAGCAIQPLAPLPTRPITAPAHPGPVRPPAVGQRWTYRQLNAFNSAVLAEVHETVTDATPGTVIGRATIGGLPLPDERHAAWGQLLRDPAWDFPLNGETPMPLWPALLQVGAAVTVNTHYRLDGGSFRYWIQVHARARAWERVTLAAGAFDALRVERLIRLNHPDPTRIETVRRDTLWLAPEVGRWVARETSGRYRVADGDDDWPGFNELLEDRVRWELTDWR